VLIGKIGMALKLAGEQIGVQEKIETILGINKELNAKSTRGGVRESFTVPFFKGTSLGRGR
jgi:hypothetical protein